jgi:hypothetical protein
MNNNPILQKYKASGRETLSIPESGKVLGIGRNQAYQAAQSGALPTLKFGKRIVVPIARLEKMLNGDDKAA